MRKEIVKMLRNTEKSYYRWKDEGRPIIAFLEKYFTEEDLKEFLNTGTISKFEAIDNNIFTNHIRSTEILKLLSILNTETLRNALYEALSKNNVMLAATIEYLNPKNLKQITKYEFLKKFEKFLSEYAKEKERTYPLPDYLDKNDPKNKIWYESEQALNNFNDKIGFDFNTKDRAIIEKIISRYEVYNTLYDLDKTPIKN